MIIAYMSSEGWTRYYWSNLIFNPNEIMDSQSGDVQLREILNEYK